MIYKISKNNGDNTDNANTDINDNGNINDHENIPGNQENNIRHQNFY